MTTATLVLLILSIPPAPEPPTLTDFVCLDYQTVTHKEELTPTRLGWGNVAGRGIVSKWTLRLDVEYSKFLLEGKIISNNTGYHRQGIPIYTGDLEKRDRLRLMAISNADGEFKFYLNSYGGGARTQDEDRYLYVGKPSSFLLRYRIPYERAIKVKSLER